MPWYIVPYGRKLSALRPTRYPVMEDFTPEIFSADGDWMETEINGGLALVKVRAPSVILDDLALAFGGEVDPAVVWTPTRLSPRLLDGEIVLDGPQVATLDWRIVDQRVLDAARLDQVKRRLDYYIGLAEKEGYARVIERGVLRDEILVRSGKAGFGLDRISPGTFATTGVLDDFDRSDADTLGSDWTLLVQWVGGGSADDDLNIISNQAGNDNTDDYVDMYWNPSTYGPNCEVYLEISTLPGSEGPAVTLRITDIDTPSQQYDGYYLFVDVDESPDTWYIERVDDGVSTQLGASFTQNLSGGDKIGLEANGSTLTAYYDSGGGWSSMATRTDSTYGGAGYIGFYGTGDTTFRYDDFGGGTIVPADIPKVIHHLRQQEIS